MLGEAHPDGKDAVDNDGVDAFFDLALWKWEAAKVSSGRIDFVGSKGMKPKERKKVEKLKQDIPAP